MESKESTKQAITALPAAEDRPDNDRSIEEIMEMLDGVLAELESGEHALEESFSFYAQGLELIKQCSNKIDMVEKRCLVLEEDGNIHEL